MIFSIIASTPDQELRRRPIAKHALETVFEELKRLTAAMVKKIEE